MIIRSSTFLSSNRKRRAKAKRSMLCASACCSCESNVSSLSIPTSLLLKFIRILIAAFLSASFTIRLLSGYRAQRTSILSVSLELIAVMHLSLNEVNVSPYLCSICAQTGLLPPPLSPNIRDVMAMESEAGRRPIAFPSSTISKFAFTHTSSNTSNFVISGWIKCNTFNARYSRSIFSSRRPGAVFRRRKADPEMVAQLFGFSNGTNPCADRNSELSTGP